MGKRNIDKARVIETMKSPHSVVNGKYGRKIAQKIYGDYLIRVHWSSVKEYYRFDQYRFINNF